MVASTLVSETDSPHDSGQADAGFDSADGDGEDRPDFFPQRLCDALPEPAIAVFSNGAVAAANQASLQLLDESSSMDGRLLSDFFSDSPNRINDFLRTASRSRDSLPGRLHSRASGSIRCRSSLAFPKGPGHPAVVLIRFDEDPTMDRFHALSQKVEELTREVDRRRHFEFGYHAIESRNSALLRATVDAVITMDERGVIESVNPAGERLLQSEASLLQGTPLREFVLSPEEGGPGQQLIDVLENASEAGLDQSLEVVISQAGGGSFPARVVVTRVGSPPDHQFTALVRDVAREKEHQSAMAEQLSLAALGRDLGFSLAKSGPISETLQDCAELLVRHTVCSFARIWLMEKGEGALHLEATAGPDSKTKSDSEYLEIGKFRVGKIAADGKPYLTNAVVEESDFHDAEWMETESIRAFAGFPLLLEDRVVGVMALYSRRDLSEHTLQSLETAGVAIALGLERKRVETDLRHHARALEEADRRKDDFLAVLGHELRNPLAPLQTGLELIERGQGEPATVATMKRQLKHMKRLVDDLLDVSRILRGKIPIRQAPVAATVLVERAVETVRPLLTERGHDLRQSVEGDEMVVFADSERIVQVLTNILNNACRYTPNGGRIELSVERSDADEVVFQVRDNGVGIDPDFLSQVFAPFSQADKSLDRSIGGLGLGLTLARRLALLHGGALEVASEGKGKGTTCTIRLPAFHTDGSKKAEAEPAKPGAGPQRILVVDDSEEGANLLRDLLVLSGGHEVQVAYDGLSAVDLAHRFQPQTLLLDIGLPGIDGYEVARRLRSHPSCEAAFFVALTGYGTDEDREKALAAGFDRHLVKPVTFDALQRVLVEAE